MDLCDLLAPDGIITPLKVTSKKHALQELATIAAERTGLDSREIFNTLLQRERLGSTGLGRGIAVPHVKLAGLRNILCLFARLEDPIDLNRTTASRSISSSCCSRPITPAAII